MSAAREDLRPDWEAILDKVLEEPGRLLEAYTAFHRFSLHNTLLAMSQCMNRGIAVAPLATYDGWKAKGRQVKKGEKGIALYRPTFHKVESETGDKVEVHKGFVLRYYWFAMSQTEGGEVEVPKVPAWDFERALEALAVTRETFEHPNGNVQGYAKARTLAINPLAQHPLKTAFHELGHILLGHTELGPVRHETLDRTLQEAEAECVALLCLEALELPGAEYARGYVQHWRQGQTIPKDSVARIIGAAGKILAAGHEKSLEPEGGAQ